MNNDYIVDGKANRGTIASAVRFRKLNRAEIVDLCSKSEVQKVFIGDTYTRKVVDKSKWDKMYLDTLHGAYSSCFNRDYLLHLCDVADYLSTAKTKKIIVAGIIIILVIIAGVVVCSYILKSTGTTPN